MSKVRIGWVTIALIALVMAVASCSSKPDLESPQVQEAWLHAQEQKFLEILNSQGFQLEKSGESMIKVAKYSSHGKGVCVVFVDGINDPPLMASAAYLLPTSEDGSSWRIVGYVLAGGNGGKMNTLHFMKPLTEDAPNFTFELDKYLAGRGIEREKISVEW